MKSSFTKATSRPWILIGLFATSLLGATAISAIASPAAPEILQAESGNSDEKKTGDKDTDKKEQKLTTATFGSGCFWCTEAVFQRLKGVEKVVSGYMGGRTKNPTYEEVCTGLSGHAEVIQVQYDPALITYADLLEAFWKTHDPTTLNRQGADVGTQYRSVVFFHTPEQQAEAEKYKAKLDEAKIFENKIVTEISPAKEFYPAEKYHQNYFNDNPNQGYCRAVIAPKVEKFEKVFKDRLKK